MPLFEYRCRKCGKLFEKLVMGSSPDKMVCPSCGSEDTKRQLSSFATSGGSGGCGPSTRFT